jgi:hypothetical protein
MPEKDAGRTSHSDFRRGAAMSTNTLSTQKPVDLDGTTSHKESRPVRMVIHNFPKYTKDLNALPIVENIKLAVVADFIAGSFAPGSQPIVEYAWSVMLTLIFSKDRSSSSKSA